MPRSLTTTALVLLTLLAPIPTLAQTVTITTGPPNPSNEPEYVSDDTFKSAILNSTNHYRDQHSAPAVVWNDTLTDFSDDYLDDVATDDKCEFEHSGGPYGENLALGYPNATATVEAWGEERKMYDFAKGEFSAETGHFTQLVWKNTSDVGCGRKQCGDGGRWYVVCEYWPRGNIIGEFREMVADPKEGVVLGAGAAVRGYSTGRYVGVAGVLVALLL